MAYFDTKFFSGRNDPALVRSVIGKSLYWWLRKEAQITTAATLDKTNPALTTLTFAGAITTPDGVAIADDDLIGGIVVLMNKNGVGRFFNIDDNTTTVVTIDITDSECESDETANFTTATSYNVKLWSPERFLGFTSDANLTNPPEYKDFVEGVPESRKTRALVRRFPGITMNVRTTDDSYDEAVYGMVETNPTATLKSHLRVGGASEGLGKYFFHGRDQLDQGNLEREIVVFNATIVPNGDTPLESGPDDWVVKSIMIDMFTEENCGIEENYFEVRREK